MKKVWLDVGALVFAELLTFTHEYKMQLHIGAEHFGNVIKRGIAKRGCS